MNSFSGQWVQASGGGAAFILGTTTPGAASGSNVRLTWSDQGTPRQTIDYYTFRAYAPNKSTTRFRILSSASGSTTGDKWCGFVATDFSSAVALHCSGGGRWEFICKNAGGQTTSPLRLEHEPYATPASGASYPGEMTYEIWWKTNASGAQLWVNDRDNYTIPTQIPSGANLPIFFGNR